MSDGAAAARRVRRTAVLALLPLLALASCTSTPTDERGSPPGTGVRGSVPGSVLTGTSLPPAAAPVDFGKPGPYKVGMLRLTTHDANDTKVVVYYPADEEGLDQVEHVTSYSSGEAFGPELRALVAGIVPEFVQDIPIDAYAKAKISHEGPFPVIIHSHGFGGFYLFGSQHFEQLASWGYVVAAPDHKSRDLASVAANKVTVDGDPDVADLSATLTLLTQENAAANSPIKGGLDTHAVGAEGHSAGGRASYLFAAKEARVKVWIGEAPSAPVPFVAGEDALPPEEQLAKERAALATAPVLGKPAMIVAAEKDSVVPLPGNQVEYEWLSSPARLVVVKNSGHAGFIDVCKPIRDQGGLEKYADKLPAFAPLFKLGDDGCGADNIDPRLAAAFTNHVMIAQYRLAFGQDPTDASLREDYLRREFPEAFASVASK